MNELTTKKIMTVREVAKVLGVTERTVQRHLFEIRSNLDNVVEVKNGVSSLITEAEATAIKLRIERSGRKDLLPVSDISGKKTDFEKELIIQQALFFQQEKIQGLQNQVTEMKPKAEFFDAVTGSADTIDMKEAAKILNIPGIGRNKLFEVLRDKGVLDRNNQPYQLFVDRGYFRIIESRYNLPTGETKISLKTVVFQRGLQFMRKELTA